MMLHYCQSNPLNFVKTLMSSCMPKFICFVRLAVQEANGGDDGSRYGEELREMAYVPLLVCML